MQKRVDVIGAGLAGCEAAWQLAKRGMHVRLYEMKPYQKTPAHSDENFAELVCSNSLRSDRLSNAVGLLKEEMRLLDSLIIHAADETRVPAGGALAVDRKRFSAYVTKVIAENENIEVIHREVENLPLEDAGEMLVIASGPLTSNALEREIKRLTGEEYLHFFDAAAPIVSAESINMASAFEASRYNRGSDYINCPMTETEYKLFYDALVHAECAQLHDFENQAVFEGCMPVETMAARGFETLLFGPLKPKGLRDPQTGWEPFAVVQLRKEDAQGSMYNLVGFQTHLKWSEQQRVFSMIPALQNAEFLRYGVMHRNTFLNAPKLLDSTYRMKNGNPIRFAGQITGVEGYVESAASGLMCGIYTSCELTGKPLPVMKDDTAIGALGLYVSNSATTNYQPMNVNFGIMRPLEERICNKEQKNLKIAERALEKVKEALRDQID